jgi:hypothetical protein
MTLGCTIRMTPASRWLAAFAAAGWLAASASAQVETVPIRFSKPFEPILNTNLNAMVGPDHRKSFQEVLRETDARGVSSMFRDDNPIGLLPMPERPRMSAAAAQKYREAADRRKNWAFTIEEDVEKDPQVSQLLKFLDADSQAESERQRSVYEQFYQKLEREGLAGMSGDSLDSLTGEQPALSADEALRLSQPEAFGALALPGSNPRLDSLTGNLKVGEAQNLADAKPRDLLGMAPRRDALSTATTRQVADFKEYERDSVMSSLSTPSQRARLDAFKNMFDSKPSAGVAAAAASGKSASALSTALGNLGLPTASSGAGMGSPGSRGSFIERFDPTPAWKPSPAVSSPLPPVSGAFPSVPTRSGTLFPTVPTRRQ